MYIPFSKMEQPYKEPTLLRWANIEKISYVSFTLNRIF